MTIHTHHHRLLPFLTLLFLSAADDSAVMSRLLSNLSPAPSGWSSNTPFCNWTKVNCDSTSLFVTAINLDSAGVSGTLPPELNQLSQLQSLALQKNSLTGTLPSFENMTSLEQIYLDNNDFISVPNNFLLGLTNLQTFSISENFNLRPWVIPFYLTESTNLVNFYASNASITGIIPDIFGSFPNLLNLRLSYNNLTGSLPGSFSGSEIQNLWLNNQRVGFSGSIDVFANMTQLAQVWLYANAFSGAIPDLSNCRNLFDLQLRDNRFTGVLPPSLMSLPKLLNITLQNNKLQGPYPQFPSTVVDVTIGTTNSFCLDRPGPCDPQVRILLDVAGALGYPMSLAESWEGNNACQDWRFINCDSQCRNLTFVNMGRQGFSGSISPVFANLTSLSNLVLNDNNLTGVIPPVLTTLRELQIFDVSNNNLSGPIPFFPSSLSVGAPGTDGGSPNGGSTRSSRRSSSAGLIAGVIVVVAVFVAVVLFVSYKCYVKRKHKRFGTVEESQHSEIPVFEGGNVMISMRVLRQATNNFSEEKVLGRGGFGVVYKGELHDGTEIAVKRMETGAMGTKGMKEFLVEFTVLTKVRHRHLVALLGYCINGNERLLVYEYMLQGTLGQHLFQWQELCRQPLTWKQRLIIALDVARGVEYLHSLAQQSFIHRDLKPSNILLSDDMRAKVADFGLVKNAPDGNYSVETRLAGTFGYLAPEYTATGKVTTKVDVYAFGVVLMEIITGRKAVDETVSEESSHLVTWFRMVLINKDNLRKSIDPILDPDDETYESICKVVSLASRCTVRKPTQRPDMGHVVNVLGPLVEQWKPSKPEEDDAYGIDRHMSLPQRWQADEVQSVSNYSRLGNIVPLPSQSIEHLISMNVLHAKLYDANLQVKALIVKKIHASIIVTNEQILTTASNQYRADLWLQENVLSNYPNTIIQFLQVGNEVISYYDRKIWLDLVPTMRKIKKSLNKYDIRNIKVGTPLAMDVLESSFPPSNPESGLVYTNFFDQILDSVVFAMGEFGFDKHFNRHIRNGGLRFQPSYFLSMMKIRTQGQELGIERHWGLLDLSIYKMAEMPH
ncbi:Serine/threonine protein kinase [Handroanthus impetiginosus]|uniref:non-specific serine/threonine protein kinase n=1 Tax=Handroanthus impetiginosus TaxID=429701 RepID=A0A2G9HYU7_9LAMI|nr:Serine/threonine protein kinase [Handroanthus impetiginosus]